MRTRLLSGGTWVCGKTIVPEGLTGPQLSFNFTVRAISEGGIKMKSKNIKRLENYPDILSLEDVRSILDVRTKKTAARWLQGKGIFYFRVGREYRIPKVHLVHYFMGLSNM